VPDTIRPYVVKSVPAANASGVSVYSSLYVQFNERMATDTMSAAYVGLYQDPLIAVPLSVSYNDSLRMLTILPNDSLGVSARHSLLVSSSVQDLAGNTMSNDYMINFWTAIPSGWVADTTPQTQPIARTQVGYLSVTDTQPANYTTNMANNSINPVRIYFNDDIAIGNRNYFGDGTSPNPMVIGRGFFEDPAESIKAYIKVENMEVLGDPFVDDTAPTLSYNIRGSLVEVTMDNILSNNEYLFTIKSGMEGFNTSPIVEDYQFVFTSTYTPLYAGYNIVRLKIGPMLQMAMAWVPNDTLNRFIYEASKEANRISPTTIDPSNPPWYVVEYVIYQGTLNALYAALALFAASGAGVRKQLADLVIEKDARGLMPAILPILDDLRKQKDDLLVVVKNGTAGLTGARWARLSEWDPRRPISNTSWRRLPLRGYRGNYQQPPDQQPHYQEASNTQSYLQWIYTTEITGVQV
jgi:hypothetical protein